MANPRFKLVDGPENLREFPEGSTQAFLAGDLVFMSSDALVICTGASQGAAGILGVAAKDASGTAGTMIPVYVATPEQVWRAYPAATKKPTANFDRGVDYKIGQASAGAAALGAAGTDAVVVSFNVGMSDGTSAGDPILIRFDQAACQGIQG